MKAAALILVFFVLQLMAVADGPKLEPPCKATIPLLKGEDGKALWLKTPQLLEQASHCEAPKFPPLAGTARIKGTIIVSILVDEKGDVFCAHCLTGHPILIKSAIEAAKEWKFKPKTQDGKPVGFYGVLDFHYSTSDAGAKNNPCLVAHW